MWKFSKQKDGEQHFTLAPTHITNPTHEYPLYPPTGYT